MNTDHEYTLKRYKKHGYAYRMWGFAGSYIGYDNGYLRKTYRYESSKFWKRKANRKFRHKNEELIGKKNHHTGNGEYCNPLY